MTTQHVRISAQKILAYAPHTTTSGEVWVCAALGTTTGAGAAGGTTLVDTNADSGGADTYTGRYWVHITSGTNKDRWKRIVDDNGSGTLTLENNGFPNQVASGVEYEIWQSPDPVVVVDSSSGETDMVDAVRVDEANDFWNGYYAVPITGTHRGKIARVTDFVSATGTFTLAASFGSALAAGDVVLLRKFVEVSDESDGLTRGYEARRQNRVNLSEGDGIVTVRGGTFGFTTDVTASGSLAASGSAANKSALSGLLRAAGFAESLGTSVNVEAGSTTTSIVIATASWENFVIGQAVVYNGNMRYITAMADGGVGPSDTITVTPALPVAPTAGAVLYGVANYRKTTDGDVLGCVLEYEVDGERITMTGCKGNVALSDGPKLAAAWAFSVDHWTREIEAAPYNPGTAYTTAEAIQGADRRAWLSTVGVDIMGWTASLNTAVAARMTQGTNGVNGRKGYQVTGYAAGMTFQELLGSSGELDQDDRFGARTAKDVIIVHGSHGDAVGVRLPVARIIEDPKSADSDGLRMAPSVMRAQDASTTIDPAGTIIKVPDFMISLS